jgi:transposase
MDHLPLADFRACVARYRGDYRVQSYRCLDQFLTLAFAQLTYRESVRDIETCLGVMQSKLYHMGFRCGAVRRTTVMHANETLDARIYRDFAYELIGRARTLYADEDLGLELAALTHTVYAFDSTTIDLCLALFPWARFHHDKGAIKLHTLLDLRGNIPAMLHITDGTVHEVNMLDTIAFEPGATYVIDRGYVDFARLYAITQAGAFFVVRAKDNFRHRRVYSHPIDRMTGLRSDQTVQLVNFYVAKAYPAPLRRVRYYDETHDRYLTFLTNAFDLPALTIAALYKSRWQVESFFKWIKQHLRIKAFYGTSRNAVETQVWIAISVYVLVAILKKRSGIQASLHTILQILSGSLFEKTDLLPLLRQTDSDTAVLEIANQLSFNDL